MGSSFIYITLIAMLSPWRSVVTKGYLLPSKKFHLSRGFSCKISNASILFNRAANERVSNNSSDSNRDHHIERKTIEIGENKKEILVGTLNLIKAMAGTGILALPYGVGRSSDFKTSIIPAIALMSVLGVISAYTFILYGRLIHASQAKTLGELWGKKMDKNSGMNHFYVRWFFINMR